MIRQRHSLIPFGFAMLCQLWIVAPIQSAVARVLLVGPGRTLKLPSQAAAAVQPGDVVRIDPGTYNDCAVWRASGVTIQAAGRNVVMAGPACLNQAIFMVYANDVTVQGLMFRDATVYGHNAAGIKTVGENLTVVNSRFEHNENGILAGGPASSTVRITDSTFIGNGACILACAHGVYAGAPIRLLDIERCVFLDTRTAHHIKSRALQTIVRDNRIEDGPSGTSSYLIETPQGGDLLVQHNILEKGLNTSNRGVAISIGIEGVTNPTTSLVIRDNRFRNDVPQQTIFVRNSSATPAELAGNVVSGDIRMLEGPGSVTP
jgi:hypothetical protein